jgi:hypothetical protein
MNFTTAEMGGIGDEWSDLWMRAARGLDRFLTWIDF